MRNYSVNLWALSICQNWPARPGWSVNGVYQFEGLYDSLDSSKMANSATSVHQFEAIEKSGTVVCLNYAFHLRKD